MYEFPGHQCTLRPTASDHAARDIGIRWRWRYAWEGHARARRVLRSSSELTRERCRHLTEYPYTLHPLSRLRLVWEVYMALVCLVQAILLPVVIAKETDLQPLQMLMVVVDVHGCVDIALNLITGYVSGCTAVLDLGIVRRRYIRGTFLLDLLATASLFTVGYDLNRISSLVLIAVKIWRAYTLIKYTDNCLAAFNLGTGRRTATRVALLGVTYIQYNMTLQFLLEYGDVCSCEPAASDAGEDQFSLLNSQCSFMKIAHLVNATRTQRYAFVLERAVAMLRQNTNMNRMERFGCTETQYFILLAWVVSKFLFYYCLFTVMSAAASAEAAASKYYVMTRQVQTCAERRGLSKFFAERIVKCYGIRYNSNFFVESRIVGCAPTRLREDMALQCARQLVLSVPFLQRVPRAIRIRVARSLQPHVFLPGDVILVVNTVGDCLYLIDKGTVAVYTESGCEVCHLDDGDYFGEIGLVSRRRRRSASVAAVTQCQLLRLSRDMFAECFATFPEAADAVRRLAADRLHATAAVAERHADMLAATSSATAAAHLSGTLSSIVV